MKLVGQHPPDHLPGVAPARGRGLKSDDVLKKTADVRRPRKGAWIEISVRRGVLSLSTSPPQGGVD